MDIVELLSIAVEHKASDLHISAGMAPLLRVDGKMKKITLTNTFKDGVLDEKVAKELIFSIMQDSQRARYEKDLECDFSFDKEGMARFRVNVFLQERGIAAVFRTIPDKVISLEELKAPDIFAKLMNKKKGLILVTGPTGSGKSTTLAAMIDHYNKNFNGHIITIEDPIEFLHKSDKSLINQRELGRDTHTFKAALKSALRQDPDLILIGELRDLETIKLALTAAETGHLVLGTLHSSSANQTINRIIDVFPEGEKTMVRTMLSESLEAIISQILVERKTGGRVAAHEILLAVNSIKNLIRENKIPQIVSMMQNGKQQGMITMENALNNLMTSNIITRETLNHSMGLIVQEKV